MKNNNWLTTMRDYIHFNKALQRIRDYEVIQKILENQKLEELLYKSKKREFLIATIGTFIGVATLMRYWNRMKLAIRRYQKTICIMIAFIAAIAVAIVAFFQYKNKQDRK